MRTTSQHEKPSRLEEPEADVHWGESGIDALIWPKPYVMPQPHGPTNPETARRSGIDQNDPLRKPSRKESGHV